MSLPLNTAAEWQQMLDDRFPDGAAVSRVLPDGTLSGDGMYLCPVLVVMAMLEDWPMIVGIGGDGHDLQLRVSSWEEIDRDQHFIARAHTDSGHYEISSWLSPAAVEMMAPVRDAQREWLLQVRESAGEPASVPVQEPG